MSIYDAPAYKSKSEGLGVFASVGILFLLRRPEWLVAIGTAFTYERRTTFLTAAHCVKGLQPRQLAVLCGRASFFFPEAIHIHPTADVAVLTVRADARGLDALLPFYRAFEVGARAGTEFHAFGFPEDVAFAMRAQPATPVPRVFMGHVQRLIANYKSPMGYSYEAAELSIAAPPGLSGGPIFPPQNPRVPHGLVADNIEVGTALFEKETTDEGGRPSVLRRERVIAYGIAVLLPPLVEWIDSIHGLEH